MKMTKALALLFAMAMVVICFNMPAFCENPWDNEGPVPPGEKLGSLNPVEDTVIVIKPENPTEDFEDDNYVDPGLILQIQFIINFHIIPNFNLEIVNK